ncbi:MAG: YncE family protein, partial [Acidimicrobiales bacterium]
MAIWKMLKSNEPAPREAASSDRPRRRQRKRRTCRFLASLAICSIVMPMLATSASAQARHRMFLGTGEYDRYIPWDAIDVFDRAELINGNKPPDRRLAGTTSTFNFPHMLYYRKSTDELYVTSLFTDEIQIFAGARTMNAGAIPARVIGGASTLLDEPHGLWIDEQRDMIYVACRLGDTTAPTTRGQVLVWHSASTANGNIAPNRTIGGAATNLDQPFNTFIDPARDYLYVANANGASANRGVVIFHSASTATGSPVPNRQIAGPTFSPFAAAHPTVHNVQVDLIRDHLYVASHDQDVFVFHNASTATGDIAADRTLTGFKHALGLYYVEADDVLYVSDADESGPGPIPGAPPQAVRVFNAASTLNGSVASSASRVIYWDPEALTDYPPQPIAIHRYNCSLGVKAKMKVRLSSLPFSDSLTMVGLVNAGSAPNPAATGLVITAPLNNGSILSYTLPPGDPRWTSSGTTDTWSDRGGLQDGVV